MSKSYYEINQSLIGLNTREQYEKLLQTNEWYEFRNLIIDLNGGPVCQSCQSVGGPIEESLMNDEEHKKLMAEIADHNRKFSKFGRENPEIVKQQLLDGTYTGQKVTPDRFKEIGRVIIQIHHTLYFWNKLPWEYQNKYLKILCQSCHRQEHLHNTIYMYRDESMKERKEIPICSRCDGSGFIPEYKHVQNGMCFDCYGAGCLFSAEPLWIPV